MFSLNSIFKNFFTNSDNISDNVSDNKKKCENSLEKRMKKIIENDNGKIRHYYKPYIVSIKSKKLLAYINNTKDNTKDKLQDKIDLLHDINEILINVSKKLYNKFDPTMIYTFHNEINLVFFYNENGESIYDGNINKILTSIVSYASILISKELDKRNILIDFLFDGHFVEFDKDYEILNFLVWRQFQCKRNTITLLYKSLHNRRDTNNLTLDDMKYSLPIVSQELFTGNTLKKSIFKSSMQNPWVTSNEDDVRRQGNNIVRRQGNNIVRRQGTSNKDYVKGTSNEDDVRRQGTVEKVRKNISIEYLYFHKNFTNVLEKYIKKKIL